MEMGETVGSGEPGASQHRALLRMLTLDQRFSTKTILRPSPPPLGTFDSVRRHFYLLQPGSEVLLVTREERSGMQLNALHRTGQAPATKNDPTRNVSNAEAEMPCCIMRMRF